MHAVHAAPVAKFIPTLTIAPGVLWDSSLARLSDIPRVWRSVGPIGFALRVYDEVGRDNLFVWASALAYSWLFAIFPFFIFVLALLPLLPERLRDRARTDVQREVVALFPSVANDMIWDDIARNPSNLLNQKNLTRPIAVFGLALALWAASGGTAMTMYALDRCYELDRGRPYLMHRLTAIGLTILMAAMLMAVLCLLPIATLFKHWIVRQGIDPGGSIWIAFDFGRWAISLLLMVLLLTVVYYCGPAIRHHFCFLTPGGLFVIIVWVVLGLLFRLYVDRMGAVGYARTYGAVGGVAILLLFFYLDALVLLIGAEINAEVDFEVLRVRRGTRDFRCAEDLSAGAPGSC